jgi:beta-N-acetylhexosaminidase
MASCGKHFPGHGFVKADSHLAVPVDKRTLKTILADDAAPYRWLGATLASVMPAHVIYPKVDSRPAGFSKIWLQDILRTRLGFEGLVFSDDLSMVGARVLEGRALSYTEAALAALTAGCDMVLLCNQSLAQADGTAPIDELIEGLSRAQSRGDWQTNAPSEARRLALLPQLIAPGWDQLTASPAYKRALDMLP